jgi:hemerythrin-like domain-containing protein
MTNRHDLYGPIHKGLRLGTAQLLIRLGNLDWRDEAASQALLAALRLHLALAKEHLEHEDAEYHPALRARVPAMAAELDGDHAHHYETFAELERLIARAEDALPSRRAEAGRALYLRFTTYFADDLAHMEREEQVALPLFHAQFDDGELMAMEGRIIASIAPERLVLYYHLMLPGMNPAERAAFLRYVRAGAPAEAYRQLFEVIARDALPPRDYALLVDDLAEAA